MVTNTSASTIFGSPLTIGYVEERITKALNTEARFGGNLKLTRLGIKQGFFSIIVRLYADWDAEANNDLPKSFILKIPTLDTWREMIEADCCNDMFENTSSAKEKYYERMALLLRQVHNAEVSFYEYVADRNLNVKTPKTFVCEEISDNCNGLIVMEDKGENSFTACPHENITVDEAKEALSALAVIHGYSLRQPDFADVGDNESFRKLVLQFDQPKIYDDGLKVIPQIDMERLGPICDEIAKYGNLYSDSSFMDSYLNEIGMPYVVAHGDLWTPNVLWENVNGRRVLSAIIDWQCVCKGWATEDIGRFLTTALSCKDRREKQDDLLQHYYNEMETFFGEKLPFTFDQLNACYVRIMPICLAINLPMYGPNYLEHIGGTDCGDTEEMRRAAKEKAIGLAEDLLYYLKLNKETGKHF